mmetsp:Transcript_4912/g.6458  ORF Transcript_4912/g.6458 Transcript_4912/m.6458 type:complete len:80 (+) Transcript_4912:248-487(+)
MRVMVLALSEQQQKYIKTRELPVSLQVLEATLPAMVVLVLSSLQREFSLLALSSVLNPISFFQNLARENRDELKNFHFA